MEEDFQMVCTKQSKQKKMSKLKKNQTLASITYQNYFRLYKNYQYTGTAMTESEEFYDIYNLNVVSIPTNKEMLRKDFNDQILELKKKI